ncbi:MAG: RNA polymerase factor sigma-54 [Pseudomonadota bacterium]
MGQSLLMTPQLQQAIKLLQLGRIEYQEAIERELLENPFLEEMPEEFEGRGTPAAPEQDGASPTVLSGPLPNPEEPQRESNSSEPRADWDDYADSFTDYQGSATIKGHSNFDDRQPPEVVSSLSESLEEHILRQVRLQDFSSSDALIARHITGNLNRDGLLESSFEEIASACGCTADDVASVADILRFFDPIGCCTSTLQECLLTQLEALGLADGLESRIIQHHLDKLEKRRYDAIAKAESVSLDDISRALLTIRSLEPRPGRQFADETVRYIVPDVYVQKIGPDFVVLLNEDGIPKLKINSMYADLLKDNGQASGDNKAYLTERARAASWLIKSIQQRQQTIFKVTESIVKFQRGFFEHGVSHLKPLVLKDIADDIGMHESTVSRVTTEKYVHTPQGLFELKFFFTSAIKTAGGADVSSSSVKEQIKQIIAQESPHNPISDQQIVKVLKAKNIDIARRTVAKYRETLGIPSSSLRKQIL